MLRRSFWGQGYATEAARAALRFALTDLQQPHVISLTHPGMRHRFALRNGWASATSIPKK